MIDNIYTMKITFSEAFEIYMHDDLFRNYIDSGCFIFSSFCFLTCIQVRAVNMSNGLVFELNESDGSKHFKPIDENKEALERTLEYIKLFSEDYENELPYVETANEKICKYMERKHWNSAIFQDKTLLSAADYTRVKQKNYRFSLRSYTAIAVGLELSPQAYLDILSSAGRGIRRENKEESAYLFIISSLRRHPIEECNEMLSQLGFKPLGTNDRN